MSQTLQKRISNSALWAAYGDALGFITELTDEKGLKWRAGVSEIAITVPWRRRIGGRFGAIVNLPAGCYSDDTQLRLATSRSIRSDGYFDVEAFAKVELPVWLSYALGAGRASKAAAANLAKQDVNWFSNFFKKENTQYVYAGGNGAAMRIQPHVWAARDRNDTSTLVIDVVRNSITTHGHIRGIIGAVFHALCLADAIKTGSIPGPDRWDFALGVFQQLEEFIQTDDDLRLFWLPFWEEKSGMKFSAALSECIDEFRRDIENVLSVTEQPSADNYSQVIKVLEVDQQKYRGAGTKTALAASAMCWLYNELGVEIAIKIAVNQLDTDTDSIATMVGAIMGAIEEDGPSAPLMDDKYILSEAERLYKISCQEKVSNFEYPNLIEWRPPRTMIDAVCVSDNLYMLAGLGTIEPSNAVYKAHGKVQAVWEWFSLSFGQSILAKHRPTSEERIKNNSLASEELSSKKANGGNDSKQIRPKTIDQMTDETISSNFDEKLIGKSILELSERPDGIEAVISFASIIAKARIVRTRKK